MPGWTVGIDFGGTTIKCGLVDQRGQVHRTVSLATQVYGRPDAFLNGVSRAIGDLTHSLGRQRLSGVGVGAPGLVDQQRGLVRLLVNVPGWRNVPLASQLARRLHVPVFVDNDVNLVALGEWRYGAGRGAHDLVCLTLGTGVGGGLILHDHLYRGSQGMAGELGHTVVNPSGWSCGCGARGCLEAHVGTAAILRMARRAMRQGASKLNRAVQRAGGRLTPELVSRAARAGDAAAARIWDEVGRWLGVGLASIVNLLNPDRIVIGGGIANAWSLFTPALKSTLREQAMALPRQGVRVVRAHLGNDAGIVGAAVLAWEELR